MSRSVSAPSSVTKTSPCWNGLMVPGSTLRYGSNFWQVTLTPRLSNRQPMDAAAMPLPRDETTPPVTNIYLANSMYLPCCFKLSFQTVASNCLLQLSLEITVASNNRDTRSKSSGVSTPNDSYSVSTTRME